MKIGIVGSEATKFTKEGELKAKENIREILSDKTITKVCSGGCHLGGIDIWVKEIATELNIPFDEYLPQKLQWNGGYKERNLKIAESDIVYCITVNRLPDNYTGMRFNGCYHCSKIGVTVPHIKSGGCWTMHKAKNGKLIIIEQ